MTPSLPERLETARLVGHRISSADLADLRALYTDRQVMATLSADGEPLADVEIRARMRRFIDHWQAHRFGVWHFVAEAGFVGRAGLHRVQVCGHDEIELLYAVMPAYWCTGMACEAARAVLAAGFETTDMGSAIAYALPSNGASRRVMEKLGFEYERDFVHVELPHVLYRLSRASWQSGV